MRLGTHIKDIEKYICVIFWNIEINIVDYKVQKLTKKSVNICDEKHVWKQMLWGPLMPPSVTFKHYC